jgi:hypothetical protein
MTAEEKTLLGALTITAVLVPVVLGAALGWPMWSWVLFAVPLVGIYRWVVRSIRRRVQREREAHVVQVERSEVSQTLVADVALPSAAADYKFLFSATVYWRPTMASTVTHANPSELAADAIVTRAEAVTATEDPSRVDVVRHRLAGVLGAVQPDTSGRVEAWAEQIHLMLSEADQARLRKFSDLRKDQDIWERERDYERSKREYLAEDVLKSTGSAVVWWLTRQDHDVENTVQLIDALAQLCAAANNAEVPASVLQRHGSFESLDSGQPLPNDRAVASQFGLLMDKLDFDGDRRALLARWFAQLFENAGKPDEAEEIRRRFDVPATAQASTDIPRPNGELQDWLAPGEEPPSQEGPWWPSQPPEEPEQDK